MKRIEPSSEHRWLQRLVGEWSGEGEAEMAPGSASEKWKTTESVRSLGGLWTLGEGRSPAQDGSEHVSLMSLGYDPARGRFVGTFIASMMTHLWVYEGSLDTAGRVLTLDTTGPDMGGQGMAAYQDVIEFLSNDHRTLTSRMRGPDGAWRQVMVIDYRRR